jgi:hypothetical protein
MDKHSKSNPIYELLRKSNEYINSLFKDPQKFLLTLIGILFILLIAIKFKPVFITIFLIGLGAFSMIYIRFVNFSHYIGFELCTLSTVLASLAYGPGVGAFTGFTTLIFAFALSGYFRPKYFISVLVLPLIGLLTPFLSHMELWQIGLIVTVLYDIIILPLYVLMGSRIISTVTFFITHVLLNYWVFSTFGTFLMKFI